jgi:hypothetical protein
MIGDGLEIGAVLAGRVPTGEIYSPQLKQTRAFSITHYTAMLFVTSILIG